MGRSKAPALGAELGLGVDVVHALRKVFDPAGILNPGNLLPREGSAPRTRVEPAAVVTLDRASMLVHAPGTATLGAIGKALAAEGLALRHGGGALPNDSTLSAWIGDGLPGAADPWLDPVDHAVAGFTARLASGAALAVRPAPRRATGPDLFALFAGTQGKVGAVTSAWLRVEREGTARALPRELATSLARNPAVGDGEAAWLGRAASAAAAVKDPS